MFRVFKSKKGNSQLLSFLALLPFLLIIFMALAQLSIIGLSQIVVQEAAYNAARQAVKYPDNIQGTAEQYAKQYASNYLQNWNTNVTVTTEYPDNNPGSEVTVTVRYVFPKFFFYTDFLKRSPNDTVQGTAKQVIEEIP